jgi:Adenosine deaminase
MGSIGAFIGRLPKVELHLHLVGSASVPTVLELARRHPDSPVPRSAAELTAFYEFRDFPHFAQVYAAVSSLVREPADVAELVLGAARDLAGQNVRYAKLTVTPYTFTAAGLPAAGSSWPGWPRTRCGRRSWTTRPSGSCWRRSRPSWTADSRSRCQAFPARRTAGGRRQGFALRAAELLGGRSAWSLRFPGWYRYHAPLLSQRLSAGPTPNDSDVALMLL